MHRIKKFLEKLLLVSLSVFLLIYLTAFGVSAETDVEKRERLSKEIAEYEAEIVRLKSQANTLGNQIAQFDTQIKLATLKINQTEEKILLLGGRITQLASSLDLLNQAYEKRVIASYKMSRVNEPYMIIFSSNGFDRLFNSYQYLKRIQEADKDLLERLKTAHETYETEKQDQEDLQKLLQNQKSSLNAQKSAKATLLEATKNDEKKYQSLLSQAKSQLAALRRFVAAQGGATILHNQTKCDSWGCYYNQRDSQWGNVGLGGSSYSTAEYGCLVNSVSMLASHYGKNITPLDIAVNGNAFVPGTGYLYHSFTTNGVNVSIATVSKDRLDSELAAGRPVIAGLYSGPDHFIVILRKEGDSYIMHDPFMENGSSRPLTDKYSVGNISSLRLVSFN